jgi:ParB family chromosome partitioning protein
MVDGYHRYAAAVKAKWKMLATMVEQRELCEGEILQRQLIVNCLREDLSPLEKAAGMQRLMELTEWPANRVAAELGFSPATVTRLLALLSLPESIIGQVQTGKIPASAAYELARIDDPVRQAELAGQLAAGELTRDGLSGAQKAARKKPDGNGGTQAVRATAQLGADRSVTVSGPSLTLDGLIQILEELLAKARRERTRGVELSTFVKVLRDQARAG